MRKSYWYVGIGITLIGLAMFTVPFCSLSELAKAALAVSLSCGGSGLAMYGAVEAYCRSKEDGAEEINTAT
jgi:hypothetical protein